MDPATLDAWIEHLSIPRGDASIVREAVQRGPNLLEEIGETEDLAGVDTLLRPLHAETIVFALALPAGDHESAAVARDWLHARSDGKLEISGADLRDAGVGEGPAIGRALADTLEATLNGAIAGREQQLDFALGQARAESN
jgi:hypothetical protein